VDYHNERLYWADAKLSVIGSIRLNGTDPIVAADSKRGWSPAATLVPSPGHPGLPAEPRVLTVILPCFISLAPNNTAGPMPTLTLGPPVHSQISICVEPAGVAVGTGQMWGEETKVNHDQRSLRVMELFASSGHRRRNRWGE
jgi:hypothetical protein